MIVDKVSKPADDIFCAKKAGSSFYNFWNGCSRKETVGQGHKKYAERRAADMYGALASWPQHVDDYGNPEQMFAKRLTFIKEYDNISALLAQGESVSKIAKKYGIHRNTMRKYLSEMQKIHKS